MTVLFAMAARPEVGQVPYILMGSDSLEINLDKDRNLISRNDDAKKIYKINDKLVSYSGRLDTCFREDFLKFLNENDCELSELYKVVYQYVYDYMVNVEIAPDAKCAIYIGCCNNSIPELAEIKIKKSELSKAVHEHYVAEENQYIVKTAGSIRIPEDDDLFDTIIGNLGNSCPTLSLACVRKVAKDYLEKAAARYPETCNQNIKFERLR